MVNYGWWPPAGEGPFQPLAPNYYNCVADSKQLGSPHDPLGGPTTCVGDPINTANGNVFETEVDYQGDGAFPLAFVRYYNSSDGQWRHNYSARLTMATDNIVLTQNDGRGSRFALSDGIATPDVTELGQLSQSGSAWIYASPEGEVLTFDISGRLITWQQRGGLTQTLSYGASDASGNTTITVTDAFGRSLSFQEDSQHEPLSFNAAGLSGSYTYAVPSELTLATFTWSGGSVTRQYLYEISETPGLLTGLIDESGTRYATWSYLPQGLATGNVQNGGVGQVTLGYNSDGSMTVANALGHQATYQYQLIQGIRHLSAVSGTPTANCPASNSSYAYDTRGQVSSKVDARGNTTTYTNNSAGLLTQQVEMSGTATQRTINQTWDNTLRLLLTRNVLDASGNTVASKAWAYNAAGQTLARCEIDQAVASNYVCAATGTPPAGVRRWTATYCNVIDTTQCPVIGLPLTTVGPRTDVADVTTYRYYLTDSATSQHGDLQSITDALGHTTTYLSYDAAGRVTSVKNANGIVTTLTYTPRGWLASSSVDGAVTSMTYTPYGAVASITDPDGVVMTYTYDGAHRLTDITDASGNRIHYTMDVASNKTKEEVFDSAGVVHRSLTRSFNTLSQLTTVTDALSHTVFNATFSDSYDANGNLVHTADALGTQHKQSYDGLNRLVSTLDNYNGTDTATQNTTSVFAYDALDRLEGVSDPDGLNTTYGYDGLNNPTTLQSPDTGNASASYDAAGNRLSQTDARGVTTSFSYDALGRRTAQTYTDTTQNISYTYDEADSVTGCSGAVSLGRLTRIIESSGTTTVYCYDRLGRRASKQLTVAGNAATTRYGYTAGSRLASLTYPSGAQVSYTRNTNGQITAASLTPAGGGAVVSLVSNVSYQPFGPVTSYTLGSGQTITRSFDANGQLSGVTSPALNLQWTRDAAGNISTLSGANSESYAYDPLQRLTGINDPTGKAIEAYTYSKTGDRLSKAGGIFATGAYSYASGTHKLLSTGAAARTYDAAGNTVTNQLGADHYIYRYNARNRLETVNRDGQDVASYTYDANGQRVRKTATFPSTVDVRFGYDEASRLLTEQSASGSRDYVWLGELPIAAVDNTGTSSTVSYVHADGLGTPRVVTNATGATLWQWGYAGNAFGEQQPTSTSGYTFNLRFPGQYYDAESGLLDNGARVYCAACGRYIQSDPIGLDGGMSTYAYAGGNALTSSDPLGLATEVWMMYHPIPGGFGQNHEFVVFKDTNSKDVYVLRGGPSGDYPPENAIFNMSANDPGTGKNMYLKASFNSWPDSPDAMSHENHSILGSDVVLDDDIGTVMAEAQSIANATNAARITYRARSSNSNSFANAAYQSITGKVPPDQDAAIGSETRLHINMNQCRP